MADLCFVVIIFVLIERCYSNIENDDHFMDIPLAKSLGFTARKYPTKLQNKVPMSEELFQQYQDILKSSRESLKKFDAHEDRRLRRLVSDHNLDAVLEGVLNRRRGGAQQNSAVGRRRSRSQAYRREKLNSQSRRSHFHHSKLTDSDYIMF